MGGGGTNTGGLVDYCGAMKDRWAANYDIVSDQVGRHETSPPHQIALDGHFDMVIDPTHWYGQFATTSAAALATYSAYNTDAYFKAYIAHANGGMMDYQRIELLRSWSSYLWNNLGNAAGSQIKINAMINSFASALQQRINTDVIPKLEVGMRDTNSVLSSAIVMAKAAVWEGYNREVSDYTAKVDFTFLEKQFGMFDTLIRLEPVMMTMLTHSYDFALKRVAMDLEHIKTSMSTTLSLNDDWWTKYVKARTIAIEDEMRTETWDTDMHEYLNKAMASISGAAVIKPDKGINTAASVLSGAAAGAAAGTYVSPGWGTAAGAVIGGVGGYLAAQ